MDALLRCFFEIVPAQKSQHEAQLREAILRAVAAGLADELVELAGQIRCLLHAQPAVQRQRIARADVLRE